MGDRFFTRVRFIDGRRSLFYKSTIYWREAIAFLQEYDLLTGGDRFCVGNGRSLFIY